jgi:hypothetical protein
MFTKQGRFFKVVAVNVIIIDKKTKRFHLYTFSFTPTQIIFRTAMVIVDSMTYLDRIPL